MQLEHSFTVPLGIDETWRVLLDLGSIAPCMPGSTIERAVPDKVDGALKVKLGPLNLTYRGSARLVESDGSEHRAVVDVKGEDTRNGSAAATVVATLTPPADGQGATTVFLATDLDVTGKPAQFGQGVMADVGIKLVAQFAANLAAALDKGTLGASPVEPEPAPEADAAGPEPEPEPTAETSRKRPKPRKDPEVEATPEEGAVEAPEPAEPPADDLPADDATPDDDLPADPPADATVPDDVEPEDTTAEGAGTTPSFATPGGLPSTDSAATDAPSVNGHGRSSAPPATERVAVNPIADAARPALVKGLAPVALAVVFVWSAIRRRRR